MSVTVDFSSNASIIVPELQLRRSLTYHIRKYSFSASITTKFQTQCEDTTISITPD